MPEVSVLTTTRPATVRSEMKITMPVWAGTDDDSSATGCGDTTDHMITVDQLTDEF